MAVPYHTHSFEIPVATKTETAEASISNKVLAPSSVGTAAAANATDFATAAQGAIASTALQPGQAATTSQGAKADTALQPAAIGTTVASFAQGAKADSAMQPTVYDPRSVAGDPFAYNDKAQAIAATISANLTTIQVSGFGPYTSVNNGSTDTFTSNAGARAWYRVKDIPTARIADSAVGFGQISTLAKMTTPREKFRWDVKEVAQDWPDLAAAKTLYAAASFYTQSACYDDENDLAFISKTPNVDPGNLGILVVVRKLSDWSYITCFTPTGFTAGWGGINKEFDTSKRYFEGRNGTQTMARWNITTLPAPLTQVAPTTTWIATVADAYTYGTYRRGEWVIGQYTEPKGGTRSFTRYASFTNNLVRTGKTYKFRTDQVGSNVSPAVDELPHMQGFAKGDGFFFSTFGGIWKSDLSIAVGPPNYMGVRLFSDEPEPSTLLEGLVDPQKFLALVLAQKGITSNRLEGEGCFVTKDGRCFGLFINKWATTGTDTGGYLLIEFFSNSDTALDVSSCSIASTATVLKQPPSLWDRDGGQYRNPATGVPWVGIDDMCNFLASAYAIDNGIDRISVYANFLPTGFIDLNGNVRATTNSAIRNASKVELISVNTTTFMLIVVSSLSGIEPYLINGSAPRVQNCFTVPTGRNYATDAAAATGGVPIGGAYHNAGAVRVRLT